MSEYVKMPAQSLKSKAAKGAVWTLLDKLSTQFVGFVVGMILARLLSPNDYGDNNTFDLQIVPPS